LTTTTTPRADSALGYAALGAYVLAGILLSVGLAQDADRVRDVGLAVGLLGLAVDMRHYTRQAVRRMTYSMSLWQDYDGPEPLHRRDRLPMEQDHT